MLDVNSYQVGALMHKMLPMLSNRGNGTKKSGILTVASVAAQNPLIEHFVYCATKIFTKYMSLGA